MIDLYSPGNENFTKNGDMPLQPITCTVTAEINGAWILNLAHPIDAEGRWKYIQEGAILRVPSFNGEQLFRINKREKQDSGIVAEAQPVFLDSIGDCFLLDVRPTNKTGQQALNDILSPNSKYTALSNITKSATAYYELKNAMEAIAGDEENSFLNRWGGEIAYNNYEIQVLDRLGSDNGVQILYGKNIPTDGLKETVDMEEVTTRIIPKAYNGRLLPGNTPWIDSPLINAYPTIHTKVVEFPDLVYAEDLQWEPTEQQQVFNTLPELYQAMREAAAAEYEAGADKPYISIECDMAILSNTEEFKDFAALEKVSLGDTVHCRHSRLEIESDARVVSLTYDCCRKATQNVSIGAVVKNYLDRVTSAVTATEKALTKGGSVIAEQVVGILDGANARIIAQARTAEAQESKVMLFEDLVEGSPTYGAMALGTTGFIIADERNETDTDWKWATFGTGKGFSADLITAGTLNAINIIGSVITGGSINGTTITGGRVNGSVITSTHDTLDYKTQIVSGSVEASYSAADRNVSARLGGGTGLVVDFESTTNPSSSSQTQITNVVLVRDPNGDERSTVSKSAVSVSDGSGAYSQIAIGSATVQGNNNYCRITPDNIIIVKNGVTAWRAIP